MQTTLSLLPTRLRDADRLLLATGLLLAALALFAPAQFTASLRFLGSNFAGLAPVIALSAALAAALKASGAEALVGRVFAGRERRAIAIAALAGALSPLCSCGVVPLIAGLLAGGVPLAPVMAFWLASPVIDPAMFVLTAGAIGLEFALAKTLAAIALGLFGGFATQALAGSPLLADPLRDLDGGRSRAAALAEHARHDALHWRFWQEPARAQVFLVSATTTGWKLAKLMAIAFLLESLMLAWVPAADIAQWLGGSGGAAIPFAVLAGIPAYLNGFAAVPLVAGLIELGMHPAVGLAFMVAGGVTSIPAAMAVWGLVRPRVFALYLVLALAGSLGVAYAYAAWLALAGG